MANDPIHEIDVRISRRIRVREQWLEDLRMDDKELVRGTSLEGVIYGLQLAQQVIADVLADVPEPEGKDEQ